MDYAPHPTENQLAALREALAPGGSVDVERRIQGGLGCTTDVLRVGEEIHIHAAARSFLHNQVRIMVGTLRLVGEGKWGPADVAAALAARRRDAAGPTAPPEGLVLTAVDYDDWGDLPGS